MNQALPRKLKSARAKLNLTQEAMAAKLGVKYQSYAKWEQGRATPSPLALTALNAAVDALVARGGTN
jgi:DNA-binding XRE family transcriptional regulator